MPRGLVRTDQHELDRGQVINEAERRRYIEATFTEAALMMTFRDILQDEDSAQRAFEAAFPDGREVPSSLDVSDKGLAGRTIFDAMEEFEEGVRIKDAA